MARPSPIPVRMPKTLTDDLDWLLTAMESEDHPAAVGAGGHWGRGALMRLLITRGIAAEMKARGYAPGHASK